MNHGRMMPSDALDTLARYDTIFLGAVGHPDIQDHILLENVFFNGYLTSRRSSTDSISLSPYSNLSV